MPTAIESGSGKSGNYLQSIPGLTQFSAAPPIPPDPPNHYVVIFPAGDTAVYQSIPAALNAAAALHAIVGAYPTAYTIGRSFFSYKTSANPILNCFPGGATQTVPYQYIDRYYCADPVPLANISGSTLNVGGSHVCGYLGTFPAAPGSGIPYIDRENDPVFTGNNVDTTAWGPCILTNGSTGTPWTATYPMFVNNCTNYPIGPSNFPQAIQAPFTIIRQFVAPTAFQIDVDGVLNAGTDMSVGLKVNGLDPAVVYNVTLRTSPFLAWRPDTGATWNTFLRVSSVTDGGAHIGSATAFSTAAAANAAWPSNQTVTGSSNYSFWFFDATSPADNGGGLSLQFTPQ